MHSAIYETYLVSCFSRDLCLIEGEGVYLPNMSTMCILLYMKLIWCNGFPEIFAQLEEGGSGQSVMKLMQCSGLPEIYA